MKHLSGCSGYFPDGPVCRDGRSNGICGSGWVPLDWRWPLDLQLDGSAALCSLKIRPEGSSLEGQTLWNGSGLLGSGMDNIFCLSNTLMFDIYNWNFIECLCMQKWKCTDVEYWHDFDHIFLRADIIESWHKSMSSAQNRKSYHWI